VLVKLSNATLPDLPAAVQRPAYDRSALTSGIVHIGLGNFHRAHQAWYLHRLMQQGRRWIGRLLVPVSAPAMRHNVRSWPHRIT
jgi:mannitol-1-phosphate/altronate dehydrogenase